MTRRRRRGGARRRADIGPRAAPTKKRFVTRRGVTSEASGLLETEALLLFVLLLALLRALVCPWPCVSKPPVGPCRDMRRPVSRSVGSHSSPSLVQPCSPRAKSAFCVQPTDANAVC